MEIKEFKLGPMPTNSQLVWEGSYGILFDCGGNDLENLMEFLKEKEITLKKVVFTHGHFDHIGGVDRLKELNPGIEVVIGKEEKEFLTNPDLSLSSYISGINYTYKGEVTEVVEGDSFNGFEVIDAPGHTCGGKVYYNKEGKVAIVGDTLFYGSYGRHDLPTGDGEILFKTLRKLCDILPLETKVYNGHTSVTTIGAEKERLEGRKVI